MWELVRIAAFFSALLVVGGTAALLPPEWANDLCLSRWAPENPRSIEQRRSAAFDKENEAELQRFAQRDRMTRRVVDQSATLFEAAVLFRRLNQEMPVDPAAQYYADCSPEEAVCRQVIIWVKVATQGGDGQVVRRLEEDLRRHKDQYGRVILANGDCASATRPCEDPALQ